MKLDLSVPWHKESFDRFVCERLPQLIGSRLSLAGYQVEVQDTYTFSLKLVLGFDSGEVEALYEGLPQPDGDGIFCVEGNYRVVVPYPSQRDLETADIYCVGEQLYHFFEQRLVEVPDDLPWDGEMVRTWLPIDAWMREFHTGITSQYLQLTNWLDRYTHLRRLSLIPILPEPLHGEQTFPPGQLGLVCPLSTPEGNNVGRLLEVARGAQIRDGKLVRVDESAEGCLSFSGSMVPFLEHDDSNRALMGINMMRQWMAGTDPEAPMHPDGFFRELYERAEKSTGHRPEPALVQTGCEPEAPDFWGGYNLLTAFVMWDDNTYEDSVVISESCAGRLYFPEALEVGDKMSNRHGAVCIVGRILPDEQMPHLPDGAVVDLIYSPTSMVSRLNFGQVREAVMGRIARAAGEPALVPPFEAPGEEELRQRLERAGLPEDGMEQLALKGEVLPYRSTVGWVYWGRLFHTAARWLQVSTGPEGGKNMGMLAYRTLMRNGAYANVGEYLNTCSAEREDAATLAQRVAQGPVEPAPPPTPRCARLVRFLEVAGISAALEDEGMRFAFVEPEGIELARPISHPWLEERQLKSIGKFEELPESEGLGDLADLYEDVLEANKRLASMVASRAPEALQEPALVQLQKRVGLFLDALLEPESLRFHTQVMFSGSAVIAPGPELNWDQVGLPEEMAWTLFGPQVARRLGDEKAVEKRTRKAASALDEIMAQAWVVLYSGQDVWPDSGHPPVYYLPQTALLAFHPVRLAEKVIRVHPRLCCLMEQDFDGNHLSVFLPLTEAAQNEAGERLSIAGHVRHDAEIFKHITDNYHGMLWGLARLNAAQEGRREIAAIAGREIGAGLVIKGGLTELLHQIFLDRGFARAMQVFEQLRQRGFEICRTSGASFSPFLGARVQWPEMPEGDDADLWRLYFEEMVEAFFVRADYEDNDLGPLALMNRSGTRGNHHQLFLYVGAHGPLRSMDGQGAVIRHSLVQGLTAEEMLLKAPRALWGLADANYKWTQNEQQTSESWMWDLSLERNWVGSFGVVGRALRARRPGVVFARAACRGEVDPLASEATRLFAGLPVEG